MMRVGQGLDVHPFDRSRPLILGGVRLSDRDGLSGHSDADAVLHALTDALLGAAGAGDLGEYFPSSDPQWKDASSSRFLAEALALLRSRGFYLMNADVTIIAERPRISPHRRAIVRSIADLLGVAEDAVNVKATTTDHLGFVGREEGIMAMAVVLVERRMAEPGVDE